MSPLIVVEVISYSEERQRLTTATVRYIMLTRVDSSCEMGIYW